MKLYVAVVGVVKEGLEPVGVYSTPEQAETEARRVHSHDFQDWDVYEFDLNAEARSEP